jgi:glutamine amidotransferase
VNPTIQIIDYGFGNLHSVEKAMRFVGVDISIINDPSELQKADGVILPGVGAFPEGMHGLESRGFKGALLDYAASGKPVLGICLGMQFLLSQGEEFGVTEGLGLIPGRVVFFPPRRDDGLGNFRIPCVGWNRLIKPAAVESWNGTLLDGIEGGDEMYFVHSYVAVPEDTGAVLAQTEYGGNYVTAALQKGNIYGCQFHPEKSRAVGLRILTNFAKIVENGR